MNNTLSNTLEEEERLRFTADEALVLLGDWFGRKACRMCKDNLSLIDDMVQEMSMGVLSCEGEQTLSFFKKRAYMRGKNLLRGQERNAKRLARYGLLAHRVSEGDDTPYIEGLIDLQDQIDRKTNDGDVTDFRDDRRASA